MPDRLTPEEIAEANKLCAEATWVNGWQVDGLVVRDSRYENPEECYAIVSASLCATGDVEQARKDLAFIAASRDLFPRALAEIESLRAQAERDRAVVNDLRKRAEIDAPLIHEAKYLNTCPDCTCHADGRGLVCRSIRRLCDIINARNAALTALDGGEGEKAR